MVALAVFLCSRTQKYGGLCGPPLSTKAGGTAGFTTNATPFRCSKIVQLYGVRPSAVVDWGALCHFRERLLLRKLARA